MAKMLIFFNLFFFCWPQLGDLESTSVLDTTPIPHANDHSYGKCGSEQRSPSLPYLRSPQFSSPGSQSEHLDHCYGRTLESKPQVSSTGDKDTSQSNSSSSSPGICPEIFPMDYLQLRIVLETRSAEALAKACVSVDYLRKWITQLLCEEIGHKPDSMKNRKRGFLSVLMKKSFEDLKTLDLDSVVTELRELFPVLYQLLIHIMLPSDKWDDNNALGSIVPKLAMVYAVVMQTRFMEFSRVQRVLSMCLMDNICDQKVTIESHWSLSCPSYLIWTLHVLTH